MELLLLLLRFWIQIILVNVPASHHGSTILNMTICIYSEIMYEDSGFKDRQLAALVASKVSLHLSLCSKSQKSCGRHMVCNATVQW